MTPMISHGGNITVNPLGVPSIHEYIQCAPSKRCGKKCLSKIYLRSALTNSCSAFSINSEPSKVSKELLITEVDFFLSAILNSKLVNKFFAFVVSSQISNFLTKHLSLKLVHKRKISSKNGLACKETNGKRNLWVLYI